MSAVHPADAGPGVAGTEFDVRLSHALTIDPSPSQVAVMDGRMAAAIASATSRHSARPAGIRHFRRAALLIAAALLTAAAGTSLLTIYGNMGGGGYGVAWDRATKFGLAQVRDGYRVTLEGAYADAARTMLAISVEDTKARPATQVDLRSARLVDDAGHTYEMDEGGSTPADAFRSANIVWYTTPGGGTLSGIQHAHLTVSDIGVRDVDWSPSVLPNGERTGDPWHVVSGTWTFNFDLTVNAGATLTPKKHAAAHGITATVESILVTPTTARVTLAYAGLPLGPGDWTAITSVHHNGQDLPVGIVRPAIGTTANEVMDTTVGTDRASGSWEVRITEFVGESASGQVRIPGTWDVRFDVP